MKFQIELETIKDYLRRLSVSVQSVSSRVEFTGVLINVWDNSITFEGRNDWMDTKIEETSLTKVKIIETGRVLVKAQMLNEIVQKMEGQTVTFTKVDSNVLTVEDADSNYQINLLSDENYESANIINEIQQEVVVPAAQFRKAISKTSFAGSDHHSKFIYQGLNLVIGDGKLTATACDGIKIASWSTNITSDVRVNKIIPLKVVRELVKVLPESEEYKFAFNNNKCVVVSGNMTNQFGLIEGTFPIFDKFFNESIYTKKLVVDKEVILNAINRATILSNIADGARIGLAINRESFIVDSKEEIGSAKIEVRGHSYEGEAIDISISPKVLSEGIKHSESDMIEIYLTEPTSSALLKSSKDNFFYLMSPMV